jgi:D-lactate dehydrogenase
LRLKPGHFGGADPDLYEKQAGALFQDLSCQMLLDDDLSNLLIFPNVLIASDQALLRHEALCEIACVMTANILKPAILTPFLKGTTP